MLDGFGMVSVHHAIVWANGIEQVEEILDDIDSSDGFEIRHLEFKESATAKAMVANAYAFEAASAKHLYAKTLYLGGFPARALHIVLARRGIDFKTEKTAGKVCVFDPAVRDLKWELRKKFNPRSPSGEMSHEHVIHISDSSAIAAKSLLLNLGPKYLRISAHSNSTQFGLSLPWHLASVRKVNFSHLSIAEVFVRVITRKGLAVVPIAESPHFRSARTGSFGEYRDYLNVNRGIGLTDWYSVRKFRRILAADLQDGGGPILVRGFRLEGTTRFLILDGVHRAVAHMLSGKTLIEVAIVGEESV